MARACWPSTGSCCVTRMPERSAAMMPSSVGELGCPRWKVAVRAMPASLHFSVVDDRKTAGSTKGRRIFALTMEGCRRSRLARRFALRSVSSSGLS